MSHTWNPHYDVDVNKYVTQWTNRDFGYPSPPSDGQFEATLTEMNEECDLDWSSLIDTTQHAEYNNMVDQAASALPSPPIGRSRSPSSSQSGRSPKNGGSVRLRLRENETRYRARLDGMFAELKAAVPTLQNAGPGSASSDHMISKAGRLSAAKNCRKATVLAKTIEYIRYLEESNDNLNARLSQQPQLHHAGRPNPYTPPPMTRTSSMASSITSASSHASYENPHQRPLAATVAPGELSLADVVDFALQWPI